MKPNRTFHVVGGDSAISYAFNKRQFTEVDTIEDADFVVFPGGADISPDLYGQKNVHSRIWPKRDDFEINAYTKAQSLGKNLVGICRGAQLLNVMNGGSMWQHVDHHAWGDHDMYEVKTHRKIRTTSVHHQMMRPVFPDAVLVCVASESSFRIDDKGKNEEGTFADVEVVWYPKEKALCFQGHPEYGQGECTNYFFELLDRFYGDN